MKQYSALAWFVAPVDTSVPVVTDEDEVLVVVAAMA